MPLVFQYGSNLSSSRLNGDDKLRGDAHVKGVAITQDIFEFVFDIWSTGEGGRAASDIIQNRGRKIWGVIYDVPDHLIRRATARQHGRLSLDAIEGEGSNYERVPIQLRWRNGRKVKEPVITYTGLARRANIQTNWGYVRHILAGLREHRIPKAYVRYVKAQIIANNPNLRKRVAHHKTNL